MVHDLIETVCVPRLGVRATLLPQRSVAHRMVIMMLKRWGGIVKDHALVKCLAPIGPWQSHLIRLLLLLTFRSSAVLSLDPTLDTITCCLTSRRYQLPNHNIWGVGDNTLAAKGANFFFFFFFS